eukprot:scaffold3354_cov369-Prasinococcus_capsulatus_cf.AAC.3
MAEPAARIPDILDRREAFLSSCRPLPTAGCGRRPLDTHGCACCVQSFCTADCRYTWLCGGMQLAFSEECCRGWYGAELVSPCRQRGCSQPLRRRLGLSLIYCLSDNGCSPENSTSMSCRRWRNGEETLRAFQ